MSCETWVPIAGYEGLYEVSSRGRIRSLERTARYVHPVTRKEHMRRVRARVMKLQKCSNGYLGIALCREGCCVQVLVHRLVAQVFIENPAALPEVNHRDADKRNNRADNLEWCTPAENKRHAHRVGARRSGSDHHFARLPRDEHGYCLKQQDGTRSPSHIECVK